MECKILGCEKAVKAKGLCALHYRRAREKTMPPCSEWDCDLPQYARDLCRKHWARKRSHGSTEWRGGKRGPRLCSVEGCTRFIRGSSTECIYHMPMTYMGAHNRVYNTRGPASDYMCQHCHLPAQEWAYDHKDPEELVMPPGTREAGQAFSRKPWHYMHLCIGCHIDYDRGKMWVYHERT
jgi:hypothetical protein